MEPWLPKIRVVLTVIVTAGLVAFAVATFAHETCGGEAGADQDRCACDGGAADRGLDRQADDGPATAQSRSGLSGYAAVFAPN